MYIYIALSDNILAFTGSRQNDGPDGKHHVFIVCTLLGRAYDNIAY